MFLKDSRRQNEPTSINAFVEKRAQQLQQAVKGLASYCKAETTFTFHFSIFTLSNAFLSIDNREMKSESGFSFAIASQPFIETFAVNYDWTETFMMCE